MHLYMCRVDTIYIPDCMLLYVCEYTSTLYVLRCNFKPNSTLYMCYYTLCRVRGNRCVCISLYVRKYIWYLCLHVLGLSIKFS